MSQTTSTVILMSTLSGGGVAVSYLDHVEAAFRIASITVTMVLSILLYLKRKNEIDGNNYKKDNSSDSKRNITNDKGGGKD